MTKCLINVVFVLLIIFSSISLYADNSLRPSTTDLPPQIKDPLALINNEIAMLDNLIDVTQQNLENQKNLRHLVKEYQKIQDLYLQNPDDKEALYRMVKIAYKTLGNIKENHLTHLFDSDFISELSLLSQVASKRGIPKP